MQLIHGSALRTVWSILLSSVIIFGLTIHAAHALTLTSPAFSEGGVIPDAFVFSQAGQCSGANASPPLVFNDVPDGTQSFALIVRDIDGGNWLHWKVWNVAATVDAFPQNFSSSMSFPQATNEFGRYGYGGPCPPSGSHRYVFTLYALSVPSLSGEPTDAQLAAAALQTATLTGYRAPTSSASWTSDKTVQKGWWWNPHESGRGYSIEQSVATNNIFLAAYLYGQTGAATWYASGMTKTSPTSHTGVLYSYANGQSLLGAYRVPISASYGSAVILETIDSDRALLTITGDGVTPGMVVALRRFEFFSGSFSAEASTTAPESGWWWNSLESGRGYFLEIQQNSAYVAAYTYSVDGTPVWYAAYNAMASEALFQGNWQQYANGQAIGSAYVAPVVANSNVGTVQIQFTSRTSASLILPNGTAVPISRFSF